MEDRTAHEDSVAELLAAIRDARFGRGTRCPRCTHEHVVGWGSFSSRQRYRCMGCRCTFSDLTGTPAAYSKKLWLWPAYTRALTKSLSVRRAATHVGVHRTTAFRWRHAFLDGLRSRDRETLTGWIEIGSLWFAYSEKGQRELRRAPRSHGVRHPLPADLRGVNVLVACDRQRGVVTAVAGFSRSHRITLPELECALAGRIAGRPTILAAQGRYGPCALYARRSGGEFHDMRPSVNRPPIEHAHLETVRAYRASFLVWLQRFQGVATRYLSNYLVWHRSVARPWRCGENRTVLPGLMALACA